MHLTGRQRHNSNYKLQQSFLRSHEQYQQTVSLAQILVTATRALSPHLALRKEANIWIIVYASIHPTPQQLLDLSAGLCSGELVDDVQRSLAVCVSHCGIYTTLQKRDIKWLKKLKLNLCSPCVCVGSLHVL